MCANALGFGVCVGGGEFHVSFLSKTLARDKFKDKSRTSKFSVYFLKLNNFNYLQALSPKQMVHMIASAPDEKHSPATINKKSKVGYFLNWHKKECLTSIECTRPRLKQSISSFSHPRKVSRKAFLTSYVNENTCFKASLVIVGMSSSKRNYVKEIVSVIKCSTA